MNQQLTPREREILVLMVEGLTNKEIAERIAVAPQTVANRVNAIFFKLGVSNRTKAAVKAIREGLAHDEDHGPSGLRADLE